ncbi:MAG: SMC-Scp complex subunit ScpB, partial [Sphaerochaetaceae bacterium]
MIGDTLLTNDERLIEVVLYLENEPVSLEQLVKITSLQEIVVTEALKRLMNYYIEFNHGIKLVDNHGFYSFLPNEDLHEKLQSCYGKKVDRRLSKAALETLSIIAYRQPTTRREVENIRGVSSDNIIRI